MAKPHSWETGKSHRITWSLLDCYGFRRHPEREQRHSHAKVNFACVSFYLSKYILSNVCNPLDTRLDSIRRNGRESKAKIVPGRRLG